MTPHRAQCLQPSLWNCFIATLIAHITNSKLRAMCAFYCPSTFNDPQPKPEIQFHFHLSRCFFLLFFAFLFELWWLKYIRNVYSKFQTLLPSVSTVFVGLFCKRCQRSQCFQMHLSMLCTCWYLRICKSFFAFFLHQLPLCWYFCHLDTVFAASLPPFLLTSATRGALVLETQSNYFHANVSNI